MKKKRLLTSLCSMLITSGFLMTHVGAYKQIENVSKVKERKVEELIDVEDGQFVLDNDAKRQMSYLVSMETVNIIDETLKLYNESVREGLITITDNGTIVDNKDDGMYVQGGNISMQKCYWWGIKNYFSKSCSGLYIRRLARIKRASKTVGTVISILGACVGIVTGGTAAVAAKLCAAINTTIAFYINYIISKVNPVYRKLPKNNGLIVEFKIWLTCQSYRQ